MGAAWYPDAIIDDQGTTGGTMKGGPPRGVIHTTEGYSPRGGRPYYHFTIGQDLVHDDVLIFQWRPVDMAARGLRNLSGGTETNREGDTCIQIAFAWKAARIDELPDSMYEAAQGIIAWAQTEHGIPLHSRYDTGHGSSAYGYGGTARMTVHEWDTFTGWCGHQEPPENTHWDPGEIDWVRLLDVPDVDPPYEPEDDMPATFRVGEPDERWETYCWAIYQSMTGVAHYATYGPDERAAALHIVMDTPDVFTPSQTQLDHVWSVTGYQGTDLIKESGAQMTQFMLNLPPAFTKVVEVYAPAQEGQ